MTVVELLGDGSLRRAVTTDRPILLRVDHTRPALPAPPALSLLDSSCALPFGGTASAVVSVLADSSAALPLAGSASASVGATGPLYPLSGFQFAGDAFAYADTAALLANCTTTGVPASRLYWNCLNLQNLSLDPTVLFDGHPTAKFLYNGAAFPNQPQLQIHFSGRGKSPLSDVWYRSTTRFMPGFSDNGIGAPGSPSNKYNAGGWSAYNSSLRYQDPTLAILMTATSGATAVVPTVLAHTGSTAPLYAGADWWDTLFNFDYLAPGVPRFRAWRMVTGQLPILVGTIIGAVLAGWSDPRLYFWYIQLNFNRSRAGLAPQWYNIGRWELVDGTLHADPFGVGG